ncbi:hypothetical protein FXV91_09760 [Methanosarcina sp. DH2]|jgi:succinate dehydrogenase flavin-adding protein (antitoxin of CptAB toxin-antitoxin module)|uniref:hypothetical protein n=1 Tax=Methanosarcina sp. DH2 TaxID=2605639 RepID=UPI001E3A33FD|nr:hypothetical protein [Methanosarcina sp. DH2]MCC4770459.1 hypothetical protein [Methanosarcina sp. DH2]
MLDTGIAMLSLILSMVAIIYTKNEKEIRNLEDSLDKFYYPLKESMESNPCKITKEMTIRRDLAEKETITNLEAYIDDIKSNKVTFEKLEELNLTIEESDERLEKWKIHKNQITEPKYKELLEHISTTISNKEKRLDKLRKR